MEVSTFISLLKLQIKSYFEPNVWEWVGLDSFRSPNNFNTIYRGCLRRIGSLEYHNFYVERDDTRVDRDFEWYVSIRNEAVEQLKESMGLREIVPSPVVTDEEVKEIWY